MLCPLSHVATAQINTDNVTLMGRNALSLDDYLTAIHYFNQVIEAKPHLSAPYYYRAYAKFSLEDYNGAEADCATALQINPFFTDVYQLRGLCRIHLNNFEGAIDDYSHVLKENPDDQGAVYNRALCRLELKDYDTADRDMDELLKVWQHQPRIYMVKAQIALERKDTLQAVDWADRLLTFNRQNEQAWSFKGRYELSKNHYQQADSCFTQAIDADPESYENFLLRAQTRHGLHRFNEALEDYDHALSLMPNHFVGHYNRGLLRALVGDKNRAIEDFDFVLNIEADNTLARYNRALLREETGDYTGAIEDYNLLIEQYPNFLYGYMARAACLRKTGKLKQALRDENRVARAQLDLKYKPGKRKPITKVRKRSDHEWDQYQQLVEETPDTTYRFVTQLIGKVQNQRVEQQPLPTFTLAFRTTHKAAELRNPIFIAEVDRVNRKCRLPYPLSVEANGGNNIDANLMEQLLQQPEITQLPDFEAHLLQAVLLSALYNYEEAMAETEKAIAADSTNALGFLQRANLRMAIYQAEEHRNTAEEGRKKPRTKADLPSTAHLLLATQDVERAIARAPQNAYLYYNRGCLHQLMHENNKALTDYEKALALDDKLSEARYNRAIIHLHEGNVEKAIPDLSRAGQDGLYKAYNLLKQAHRKESRTSARDRK